ncbi:MAG: hypothetical protein LBK58_10635 [Prevotellaceae bacterium]|jgi:hypothetical protein|nr:hypothetical protein [Prevotellaceae bacterium]
MKNSLLILSFLLFLGIKSQAQAVPTEAKDPIQEKTNAVASRLNLDDDKKKSVYNIFSQTEKRITDLALGTPDYMKLIKYIDQERLDMLKSALSSDEFTSYQKFFTPKDNNEIIAYIKKNNTYLTKKSAEEAKAKKSSDKIMQTDKLKLKKEAEKEKQTAKKAADKQKLADKRAADKEKANARKEKEKLKREENKQKAIEKKNAAKQKAMEKKQKELDKKLNKK